MGVYLHLAVVRTRSRGDVDVHRNNGSFFQGKRVQADDLEPVLKTTGKLAFGERHVWWQLILTDRRLGQDHRQLLHQLIAESPRRQEEITVHDVETGALRLRIGGGSGPSGSGLPVTGGVLLDSALQSDGGGRNIPSQDLPRRLRRLELPPVATPLEPDDPFKESLADGGEAHRKHRGHFLLNGQDAAEKLITVPGRFARFLVTNNDVSDHPVNIRMWAARGH